MGAFYRVGLLALGLSAAQSVTACSNNGSQPPEPLANSEGGEGATETNATRPACNDDSECPEGVACIWPDPDAGVGQCGTQTSDGPAGGDAPPGPPPSSGAAGGTCLAGSPECDDLGPADGPAPALCQSDEECPESRCVLEPGEDTGVCEQ